MLKFRPVQHKLRKKKEFSAMYAYFLQTFGAIAKGYKYSNRHCAYRNFRYREFQTFYLSSLYFFLADSIFDSGVKSWFADRA